ncbi:Kae1-associated kinase Bud32 [Stygiolobus caldivivus]|uniref:non-specific serine/threonine protein kinase n=1 Tax=Stygiolobus caldivivus TaxID=2824673 RepID=A0A8D5ZJZ4_9CREN|nr:Kae1-associated kinase Bud32 [Stygiolobus caldivivus]BCU70712.1 Kae1-associated kinase Bud32 [Stygiolobus caldivivus]
MEELREIRRGAEAIIYEGYFAGIHAIFKKRIKKSYRHPQLDYEINSSRTKLEARLIYTSLVNGVNTPALLLVDPSEFLIVMEYLEGTTVKEYLQTYSGNERGLRELGAQMGEIIGKLHKIGISHGDPNTNNLILTKDGLFIIDFGLAKKAEDIEDLAVDIHVFLRSLESTHSKYQKVLFDSFLEGYKLFVDADKILEKVKEIRMRGRYVEERRKNNK